MITTTREGDKLTQHIVGEMIDGADVVAALTALGDCKTVFANFDSRGGDSDVGVRLAHGYLACDSTAIVRGLCFSSAPVAMLGCRTRIMHRDAQLMFHSPWKWCIGNPRQLRFHADDLERRGAISFAEIIAMRDGRSPAAVLEWLQAGNHYFTAVEALAAGYITEIIEPTKFEIAQTIAIEAGADYAQQKLALDLFAALGRFTVPNKQTFAEELLHLVACNVSAEPAPAGAANAGNL